jgi:hypothetical protein
VIHSTLQYPPGHEAAGGLPSFGARHGQRPESAHPSLELAPVRRRLFCSIRQTNTHAHTKDPFRYETSPRGAYRASGPATGHDHRDLGTG